ncbi:MAG: TNT domain-containing protein [Anaerorhabdus sp.]|uniref:TNT domain-containing protein n=1 Tax=Anaerorhabdus sp. TaxID=1872524 RepID=UPI003A8BF093
MRVYRSNETEWIDESYTVTMYGLGIETLIELNNDIAISYIEQENDAYGYMSCYSYDSKHMEIENITKIKEGLFDYTQRIHEIIAEKDQTYLKEINEVFEEFSHLDINEYTVPNSLGITEYVDTAVAYYNGTSAINSGMVTKSVMIEQEKKEITLKDILLKTDAYRIEASIKKRIQEEGVVLSANDIEMVKNYQITMLTTSNYNHQFYVNEGTRITMIVLDALPIVGGIKNISEAMFGHSWVGEKLTEEERKAVGGIGTFSLLLDVFTLGSGGLSNLGKNYVIDATATLAFTGGSEIASQLLLETGLTPEQILVIKYIVGAGIIGYNGYKRMEDYFDKKVVDPSQFKNDFIEGASGSKTISKVDRTKIDNWKFIPDDDLYLKYKDVYDNPKFFNQSTGDAIYPGMNGDVNLNGFVNGKYNIETLQPGKIIDRYGSNGTGKFFSPSGTSYRERALPPFMEKELYTQYRILQPIKVKSGKIAPWFNQTGNGTQFLSDYSVDELIKMGIIEKVK